MTITIDGTNGISPLPTTGNLNFTGTGNRITGDFSNATWANKVLFQSSTTNGQTAVGLLPNGTSTQSQFIAFNGTDPSNSSYVQALISATDARFNSGQLGTGTNLPMTFYTGGSERLRIDTSGNLGLGVTPSAWFSSWRALDLGSGGAMYSNGLSNVALTANAYNTDGSGGWTYKGADYANLMQAVSGTFRWYTAPSGTAGGAITFTERMRIDSSGNLLVGQTSPIPTNGAIGIQLSGGANNGQIHGQGGSGYNFAIWYNSSNSAVIGSISNNGGTGTTYATTSDYRLKENIQPMQNALGVVTLLKPVTYTWKSDGSDGQGFIAHELQAVVPDCVTGEKDAADDEGNPVYQGIDTSFLVATLCKAIQELKAEVDELKAKAN